MKKLIVVEPTETYIDFLNSNHWPHESWKEDKTWMLSTPSEGRPAPKKEMIIGLHCYFEED